MAAKANIIVDQGTDFSTTITVRNDDGNLIDLAGYSAAGQIRKHYTSTTAVDFGTSFETPRSAGLLTLTLSRTQTANMEPGRYLYDVELTDSANTRSRLVEGVVTVTPQITSTEGS